MITAERFAPIEWQLTLYTPGLQFLPQKVVKSLRESERGRELDGTSFVVPVDDDAPAEIPRLLMTSQQEHRRAQASRVRFDLYCTEGKTRERLNLQNDLEWSLAVATDYVAATRATVGRVACVLKRITFQEEPGLEVARHFCKERWIKNGPLNRPKQFELHSHKQFPLTEGSIVNSWFRVRAVYLVEAGNETAEPRPAITVEQDLNTRAEELPTKEFDSTAVRAFANACLPEFDKILRLYFPNGEGQSIA